MWKVRCTLFLLRSRFSFSPTRFLWLGEVFDEATDQHQWHISARHKGECSRIFCIFLDILYVCIGLMPIGYVVRLDLCIHILTILVLCNSLYKWLLSMNKMMILLLSLCLYTLSFIRICIFKLICNRTINYSCKFPIFNFYVHL